jgi:ribosomal protein S27E
MAQIFVSHSSRDRKQLDFISRAFATTNVQAKYEEIEEIVSGRRNANQIRADILASNAIMIVLGSNAESLKHTRDWIAWEAGVGAGGGTDGTNKDIWVLEAFEDYGRVSVVIPHVRYYASYQYTDPWLGLLRTIIASYDDSHVLKAMAAGAGLGGLMGQGAGAVVGGLTAMILAANSKSRPAGTQIICPNCRSVYTVYLAALAMRCPVCNAQLCFPLPNPLPSRVQNGLPVPELGSDDF